MRFKASPSQHDRKDHIFEHASEVVSPGLLFQSNQDVIKEGDGKR